MMNAEAHETMAFTDHIPSRRCCSRAVSRPSILHMMPHLPAAVSPASRRETSVPLAGVPPLQVAPSLLIVLAQSAARAGDA